MPVTDTRYEDYEAVADFFASQTSSWGVPYEVVRVYSPGGPPATPYTNSIILNNKVYVPITGNQWDDEALETYGKLAQNLDRQIVPLSSNIEELVKVVTEASKQADKTLKSIENVVGEDSIATVELTTTLKEFSSAARSIRYLADYLNRHPETLVRGKTVDIGDNR